MMPPSITRSQNRDQEIHRRLFGTGADRIAVGIARSRAHVVRLVLGVNDLGRTAPTEGKTRVEERQAVLRLVLEYCAPVEGLEYCASPKNGDCSNTLLRTLREFGNHAGKTVT